MDGTYCGRGWVILRVDGTYHGPCHSGGVDGTYRGAGVDGWMVFNLAEGWMVLTVAQGWVILRVNGTYCGGGVDDIEGERYLPWRRVGGTEGERY